MKAIKDNFLVVSDFNWLPKNIKESWVEKYSDNYLIYDRAGRWEETDKIKRQKNVGQNIYDIFDFIVTHYDNLPECTIFCRAAIFFPKGREKPLSNGNCSVEKFLRLANNKTFTELHDFGREVHVDYASKMSEDGGFLELNNSWWFRIHNGKYFKSVNDFLKDIYVNPEIPKYIRFSPGGSYIIPKSNILKHNKYFYERMREYLSWGIIIGEAHMIERCLYTIFTSDCQLRNKYIRKSPVFKKIDLLGKIFKVWLWNNTIAKIYNLFSSIKKHYKN